MQEKRLEMFINLIKLPLLLLLYLVLMLLSFIAPSKYLYKIIDIVNLEETITMVFNDKIYIKIIALELTVIIFILFQYT